MASFLFLTIVKLLFYYSRCVEPKPANCHEEACPKNPSDCLVLLSGALNGTTFDSTLLNNLFQPSIYDSTCKSASDFNLCLHNWKILDDGVYAIVEKYMRFFAMYVPCQPEYKDSLQCMDETHKKSTNSCVSFCIDKYLKSKNLQKTPFLTSCNSEKIYSSELRSTLVESTTKVCQYRKCFERCIITRKIECPEEAYKAKKETYHKFLLKDTALYKAFKADLLYAQTGLFYNIDSCCVDYDERAFVQQDGP